MNQIESEAIVLHKIKYRETSLILHLYGRNTGRLNVILKAALPKEGARKKPKVIPQPMSVFDIMVDIKTTREVQLLKSYSPSFVPLQSYANPVKTAMLMLLAEILDRVLQENNPSENIFDFVKEFLYKFDKEINNYSNLHLYFIINLCKTLGIYPEIIYNEQDKLSENYIRKSFSISDYNSSNDLDDKLLRILYQFSILDYEGTKLVSSTSSERLQLLEWLWKYIQQHLHQFPPLKTLPILKDIFHR